MRIAAGVVVVLAAAFAVSTATATGVVRISGGSPAQQRVVRVVLGKLRSQRITAVTFKPHAHLRGITNGQRWMFREWMGQCAPTGMSNCSWLRTCESR